jgi:eukaryotic-like serine/threonine-protein kinase
MRADTLNPFEEVDPHSSIRPHSSMSDSGAGEAASPGASVQIRGAGVAPDDSVVGKVLDGKYRIERKIGEGAMGIVLAATHVALDEPVAIKFMRPDVQRMEGTLERFAKEAKIAARIRSEHVAKVLDVGEVAPLGPYIVMEYLEGKSLADLLDARLFERRGPMSSERVVEYLLQACEALAAAHAIGVIHRDVKPDNLFVTRHAGLETLKLLDFGISKAALTARVPDADVGTGTTAFVMGTPLYMSPEQLRSLPDLDCRTDIWSMGAVMYELLSGQPPFHATSVPEICAAILDFQPAPLPPSCPPALAAVVLRCLEKDRERRFQTVAELANALLPLAPGEARAYANRASCILRSSALQLDVALEGTNAGGPSRGGPHTSRVQSSALVAAATVLALSALGVAISLSKARAPSATLGGPPLAAPARAPAPIGAEAPSTGLRAPTSAGADRATAAAEPNPSRGAEAAIAVPVHPALAPPEARLQARVSPKGTAARPAPRAPVAASPVTQHASPVSSENPALPASGPSVAAASRTRTLDAHDRIDRVRLVEPRPRLRLVGHHAAPIRPALVEGATVKSSTQAHQRGIRQ